MGVFGKIKRGLKKVFTPENIGTAAGFAVGGPLGAGIGRSLGGVGKDVVKGEKVSLGGALKDFGTGYGAGYLGGKLPGVGGLGGKFGRDMTIGSALKGAGVNIPSMGMGGADMSGYEKWALGLGTVGALGDAYGSYQEGKGADADRQEGRRQFDLGFGRATGLDTEDRRRYDQDFGEDTRRWDTNFGEDRRRYDQDFGENTRRWDADFGRQTGLDAEDTRRWDLGFGFDKERYGDERADVQFGRDQRRRSADSMAGPFADYFARRY